ncbi:calcium/sodium antiporter [Candidatus Peregrinibacteria bacterium]|jgi:cation:H+ antiporter|nr:calcium/sodium antiporter [Candidatus Peregrinibacteria bacterium]
MTYFFFVLGFYALIKGADLMIDGASAFAKRFGVSSLVIGLTVVAFGTSAPELIVSILASLKGHNELAIGNIIGSNIANVFLILGLSAIFTPLIVKKQTVLKEIPFAILAIVLLAVFVNDTAISHASENMLSRSEGFALLSFFGVFVYYTFGIAKHGTEKNEVASLSLSKSMLYFVLGCIGLALGGQWIVDGAVLIAKNFGMSEGLIGLTIVAIGTSLPELAASIIAAKVGETDLAVGNIIGSNIFNIFLVLGVNASIQNIPFQEKMNGDVLVAVFSILLLFIFVLMSSKHKLYRWQGGVFVLLYVVYIGYLVFRG